MTLPPLNLNVPLPCSVKVRTTVLRDTMPDWGGDLGDTYWIRRGIAWVGFWAFWNTGAPALDGTPFEGNVIDWSL